MSVTNPSTLTFFELLACRLNGARFIVWIEDVYMYAMVPAGIVRNDRIDVRLHFRLQAFVDRSAEWVVVLGRDMHELVLRRLPKGFDKVAFLPNWADLEEINPIPRERNSFMETLRLVSKFIVQYSEIMERNHCLESILEYERMLKDNHQIYLLFIGWDAKDAWLRNIFEKLAFDNVKVLIPQPREPF